jgi:quaternary ammonium compound-resistance protein SugE
VLGSFIFKEKITPARLISFASIIGGAVLLRLTAV